MGVSMRNVIVHAVNLGYKTKRREYLKGINLSVGKGEIYSFYSNNDMERDVFARLLLGLITPVQGYVEIIGRKIPQERNDIIHRIGYMLSANAFYRNLTVEENLNLHFRLTGDIYNETVERLLDKFKMNQYRKSAFAGLSEDCAARLGLIRAFSQNPELVILNAPTLLLDMYSRKEIWNYILELSINRGITVIILTKDAKEAEYLSSRVGILDSGRELREYSVDLYKGKNSIYIELTVDNPVKAAFVLENTCRIHNYKCMDENNFIIFQDAESSWDINRILNENGISVSRFNPVTESLFNHILEKSGVNDE